MMINENVKVHLKEVLKEIIGGREIGKIATKSGKMVARDDNQITLETSDNGDLVEIPYHNIKMIEKISPSN